MGYRCSVCQIDHGDELPDLGMQYPDPYLAVPEEERAARTTFTPDRCTVKDEDGEHYFIRGVIEIPLRGQEGYFGIGVWVSQSRTNFERYCDDEEDMEPTFGWLVNEMAHYPETTRHLKTRVHFRGGNLRPTIELEPTDHPLSLEQQHGISIERAWQIVHRYMAN